MLEKVIDKYYARKLEERIRYDLMAYPVDKNFVYTKHRLELYLKKKRWQEKYYRKVFSIPYRDCLDALMRGREAINKELTDYIDQHLKD